MNISSTSGYVSPLAASTASTTAPVTRNADSDDDGPRPHKVHGGGHMHEALMQALQSLGLSMPQSTGSANGAASTDSDGDKDGSGSAGATGVKQDMRQFMHALFQAVKGEDASGTSIAATAGADPKANFSSSLSALISQVGSGNAPAGLQDAFSKLVSDLQTSGSPGSDAAAGSAGQPTLQALLTQLQQRFGYGSTNAPTTGNVISTAA